MRSELSDVGETASQLLSRVEGLGEYADLGSAGRDSKFGRYRGSGVREDSGAANEGSETAGSKDSEIAASAGPRDSRNSISVGPGASDEHEDSETAASVDSGDGTDPREGADSKSEGLESDHLVIVAGKDFRDGGDPRSNREFAGSTTRSGWSDVSGTTSQLFLQDEDCISDSGEFADVRSGGPQVSDEDEGSETVESENSQIVTGKDSRDCSNSISVCPRAFSEHTDSETMTGEDSCDSTDPSDSADSRSEDRNSKSDNPRASNGDEGLGTAAGEDSGSDLEWLRLDIGWSRSYNGEGVSDGEESSSSNREFAGSSTRSQLSDASGNVSQLFSKTGSSIRCSSWTSSHVADKPRKRELRRMSETESGDGEDSRRSRDLISEGSEGSGEGADSETANGNSETVDIEDSKITDSGDSEITDGEGCRDGWGPRFKGSGVSDRSEDSGSNVESEHSGPEDSEGLEGGRRRDSEGSSHNVGVPKSGIDEASRTDTASRDHNRSRLPCCDRSEHEDGRGSRSRDRKLSELNVMTGAGWNPRAASNGNLELEVRQLS